MIESPSVLALVSPEQRLEGCTHWRVWRPFAELQRRGYRVQWVPQGHPLAATLAESVECLLYPRMMWHPDDHAQALADVAAVHAEGRRLLYEADDDLFSDAYIERLVSLHGRPRADAEREADAYRWTVAHFDGVTVSSPALAEVVRRYTSAPVEVVPNALDLDWFRAQQRRVRRTLPGLVIGWQGGIRPDADVALMAEAWRRVARRYPSVRFLVRGFVPECIQRLGLGSQLIAVPWIPVSEYPIGLVSVDIGCCPLESTPWNACKTPIKAWEWATSGVPVVASPLLYGDVIEDGRDGYIASTVHEWEEALSRLVESRPLRERLARRLLAKVERRYSLTVNAESWPRAWARIRDRARR